MASVPPRGKNWNARSSMAPSPTSATSSGDRAWTRAPCARYAKPARSTAWWQTIRLTSAVASRCGGHWTPCAALRDRLHRGPGQRPEARSQNPHRKVTSHESRVTRRVTSHESRVTSHESRVTSHFPPMSRLEITDADYRMTGLSLNGHPMRHLRKLLSPNAIRTADDLMRNGRDGERVRPRRPGDRQAASRDRQGIRFPLHGRRNRVSSTSSSRRNASNARHS